MVLIVICVILTYFRNIKLSSHATQIEALLSTPKHMKISAAMTPFRPRGQRHRAQGEGIVKPVDITATIKRKVEEEEAVSLCFPDEDNNSVLNFSKLNNPDTQLISPPRKRTRLSDVTSLNMSVKSMRRMSMFKTADAVSILTTPTINKVRSNVSHFRVDVDSTPTSILKVKQLIKEAPAVVESDKMLDVSLSLDNTPTMMRSRDTTPNKSLRFKEPRKVKVDLATEEEKEAKDDDSHLSNETNDSFFSLGSQMDVDSPRVMPREAVESPLATASFPDRTSSSSRDRSPVPRTKKLSGLVTNVSPVTKARLEKALEDAEKTLRREKEPSESNDSPIPSWVEATGLIGDEDVILSDVDSDVSRRGKVTHRWIGTQEETKSQDSVELIDDDEDEEDEDAAYYEKRTFERKTCDIVVESSEEANEETAKEDEVVIDSSSDEDEKTNDVRNLNFSWAPRRQGDLIIDEEIAKIVSEEELKNSPDQEKSPDEERHFENKVIVSDFKPIPIASLNDTPIQIDDSPLEAQKFIFTPEVKATNDEDVIEIESDEDKSQKEEEEMTEPIVPTGQILFSSMFSASSVEEEEEEEVIEEEENVEEVLEIVEDPEPDIFVPTSSVSSVGSYSYVTASDVESARKPTVRKEEDELRDILDNVSTTATRASSIAGSVHDLESRADSVIGKFNLDSYAFSFNVIILQETLSPLQQGVTHSVSLSPVRLVSGRQECLIRPGSSSPLVSLWRPLP